MCFSNCHNSLNQLRTDFMSLKPPNTQNPFGRRRNSIHSVASQQCNKGSQSSRSKMVQESKDSAATDLCMREFIFIVSRVDEIILFLLLTSSEQWLYGLRISCHKIQCKGTFVLYRKYYYCSSVSYSDCFLIAISYCFATSMAN